MPVGSYNGPTSYSPPNNQEMSLLNSAVSGTDMYQGYNPTYQVDPSVGKMLLMENPNVKTVVRYNSSTGDRCFDVIDISTGESIPNVDRPDPMFLSDITIDTRNLIARNVNMDQSYQLIVSNNENMNKY